MRADEPLLHLDGSRLSHDEQRDLVVVLENVTQGRARNRIADFFPDTGPLRRELYPKHIEFFAAGAKYRERCLMAGNRTGKTEGAGGYETAMHLTGRYPDWWPGRRFTQAVHAWACGKTNETTRDIVQAKLLGKVSLAGERKSVDGTGLISHKCIGGVTWKQGVSDLADTVRVKHASGDWSTLGLKSYAQGRGAFEGTEQDIIWLDEEPPPDIYGECLIRTATTNGLVYITFTPLEGATDVVTSFLPPEMLNELMEQVSRA